MQGNFQSYYQSNRCIIYMYFYRHLKGGRGAAGLNLMQFLDFLKFMYFS